MASNEIASAIGQVKKGIEQISSAVTGADRAATETAAPRDRLDHGVIGFEEGKRLRQVVCYAGTITICAAQRRRSASLRSEVTAKSQRSEALAISNRAAVCGEMRFIVEVQREILRVLCLHNLDVFSEDPVIEIEGLLDWRILVEVAAKRNKQLGPAR